MEGSLALDESSPHRHGTERCDSPPLAQGAIAITMESMGALVAWSSGETAAANSVRDCEHRADDTKREVWRAVRDSFSPPLDAEDLYTLSADLDEVLNAAKDLVREMVTPTPDHCS